VVTPAVFARSGALGERRLSCFLERGSADEGGERRQGDSRGELHVDEE